METAQACWGGLSGLCTLLTAQCQCRTLPCCAPDEPCECNECGCARGASSRPFQAIIMFIALSCAVLSTLAMVLHTGDSKEIVYQGFTRTHDELVSKFNIPDRDAWAMHFMGECARARGDRSMQPMTPLRIDLAYELIIVLPHMWWRMVCGALRQTQGCGVTQGLYWFSPQHTDHVNCSRREIDARGAPGHEYFANGHPEDRWIPAGPALKAHYRSMPALLESQKPRKYFRTERKQVSVVISNIKAGQDQFEALRTDEVELLVRDIQQSATKEQRQAEIVYVDSLMKEAGGVELMAGDHRLVRGSTVHRKLVDATGGDGTSPSYQEVQLRLMAHAECFVALHGGANYATLYFGRPTVMLHRTGEVADAAHGIQYAATLPLLGGSRIVAVTNTTHMRDAIVELISTGACDTQ
eukprot:TRINITY_DN16577_c0_g1_i1.p1 TRINITY_DN16577_c0_g1~~TRINITY_DN16577_c0_g1_i1.p1  ORF type:complete len:411 (-),score=50.97 TRINITY_DN16577_c0_g1_i1:236-1468(-)